VHRGAGRAELATFVRPFRLAASRSPSPWPSPPGRGDTASRAATSPGALDWRKRGGRFSLSPRERAGVRGKSCDPVDQIHAQCFDATPHPVPTALELGESTALLSLSSDGGGGEGRGEESRFYWISPLPNPLPARSSQGEGDRRSAFQCLIQWQCTLSLSPFQGEREFTTEMWCGLRTSQ
jgi:hypothetical protein